MVQRDTQIRPAELRRRDVFSYYGRLGKARDYVERHLADGELDLREVAAAVGLHPKYFSCYFHEKTGICFRDWLSALRIERAAQALRCCDESITEIAWNVGYRNLRTFQRAFRRHAGMSAREYRNGVRPDLE